MLHNLRAAVAVVLCLAGAGTALAQSPQASSTVRVDYSQPANWLCRPGRKDACDVDLDATVVAVADGVTVIDPVCVAPDVSETAIGLNVQVYPEGDEQLIATIPVNPLVDVTL